MIVGPGSPQPFIPGAAAAPVGLGRMADARASDKEVAVMRPGAARTPVTISPGGLESSPRGSSNLRAPGSEIGRDGVGRSLPGLDGSRGSRFAENVG